MATPLSFSAFCADLGLPLKNSRWSWCAVNAERRQALFTIWDKEIFDDERTYEFTSASDSSQQHAGVNELRRVIDRTIGEQFEALGVLCVAKESRTIPRVRERFETDRLLRLNIYRHGSRSFAELAGTVKTGSIRHRHNILTQIVGSAVDDIEAESVGNTDPEYRERLLGTYVRNPKVRKAVLKRAKGLCEECGMPGFLKADGSRYLETHHVISLSEQGPDRPHNVIALCADDHRRAHSAADWITLQDRFMTKLEKFRPAK